MKEFSPAIKELLSVHELFRKLGFLSRDLYIDIHRLGCPPPCSGVHVQFVLRYGISNHPVFRVDINHDCKDVEAEWPKAAAWWNSASVAEMAEIYERSFVVQNKLGILMALAAQGLISEEKPREVV